MAVSPFMISFQPNTSLQTVNLSVCATKMRDNTEYVRYYILLANFLVMALAPLVILSVLNTLLYRAVRRARGRTVRGQRRDQRDQAIAIILAGIVIVFAFCNVFRIIINLYEVFHLVLFGDININWPFW